MSEIIADAIKTFLESAEEMLSTILNKDIFWQSHSQDVISDRQKHVLNTSPDFSPVAVFT